MSRTFVEFLKKEMNQIVIAFIFLLLTHFFFVHNERYTIISHGKVILNNVSESVYNTAMYHADSIRRQNYLAQNTIMKYFGVFPDWSSYIIMAAYYVLGFWTAFSILKEKQKKPIGMLTKSEARDKVAGIMTDLKGAYRDNN